MAALSPFPSLYGGLLGGGILGASAYQEPARRWVGVQERFEQFYRSLALTELQRADAVAKATAVVRCLNSHYYPDAAPTDTLNGFLVGSWGKRTAIRPPRDVDVFFQLPVSVYHRFQLYTSNKQTALLQEVKSVLLATYPNTDVRADGQVVVVDFTSVCVEVVPAFLLQEGGYWICHTHDGGTYQKADPKAEIGQIDYVDSVSASNLRPLIHMLKAWQSYCSVPLASFELELLMTTFIQQSPWQLKSIFYYDWLVRDFFAWLLTKANSFVVVPGTFKIIYLGDAWKSRAQTAYDRALKACEYEYENWLILAGEEWQKIFGTDIPRYV